MSVPHLVRMLASVRIPSGHGPNVDYEIVHAVVSDDPDGRITHESVFLRLVVGDTPLNDRVAEVLVKDLAAVQTQWSRFIQDVLWRRAQAGDHESQTALEKLAPLPAAAPGAAAAAPPVISASGGRFGQGAGGVPFIPVKKEKKKSEMSLDAPIIPGVTGSSGGRREAGRSDAVFVPLPAADEKPSPSPASYQYDVIAFNIATPPTADNLMGPIRDGAGRVLVVAPISLVQKVEEFIAKLKSGAAHGRPATFNPIVIRRQGGDPDAFRRLRTELAGGIARMLGDPTSALWIMPH